MATVPGRLARIRGSLTRREWARAGGLAGTVIGLNVLGWGMLAFAVSGHYHVTGKETFGFGTGHIDVTNSGGTPRSSSSFFASQASFIARWYTSVARAFPRISIGVIKSGARVSVSTSRGRDPGTMRWR